MHPLMTLAIKGPAHWNNAEWELYDDLREFYPGI